MTNIMKHKKGATLVELLAVIVILGIIAAIAVPTIGGLIARQRANAAEATYTQIVSAAQTYAVAESDNSFTLEDLIDNDYIGNLDVTVTGGDEGDVSITVSGSTVTVALTGTATAIFFNDVEMELSGLTLTGNVKP